MNLESLATCKPETIIGVKNELTNDGIIYAKYVQPIFVETLSNV